MKHAKTPRILCIGASDSYAAEGIQADIKTAQAFGVYAATVVTTVQARNTSNASAIYDIPSEIVRSQIEAVLDDFEPHVVKIGMLGGIETIKAVGDVLDQLGHNGIQVVLDPVLSGHLKGTPIDKECRDIMKRSMMVYADILTPNVQEAAALTGMEIADSDQMAHAAEMLLSLGPSMVVLKGDENMVRDGYIIDKVCDVDGFEIVHNSYDAGISVCGAGSTLATAMACCLSQGMSPRECYFTARDYLNRAIQSSVSIGDGARPLGHNVDFSMIKAKKQAV